MLQQTCGNPWTKIDRRIERRRDRSEKREGSNGRRKRRKERRERERPTGLAISEMGAWVESRWWGRNTALHPSGGDRSGSRDGEVRRNNV